jgi:hypothetical protein
VGTLLREARDVLYMGVPTFLIAVINKIFNHMLLHQFLLPATFFRASTTACMEGS